MKNTFHTTKVGNFGNKQSVFVKGGALALVLLALSLSVSSLGQQATQHPAQYVAEGDGTKVGAGG